MLLIISKTDVKFIVEFSDDYMYKFCMKYCLPYCNAKFFCLCPVGLMYTVSYSKLGIMMKQEQEINNI